MLCFDYYNLKKRKIFDENNKLLIFKNIWRKHLAEAGAQQKKGSV
jgi:hypothetical protein